VALSETALPTGGRCGHRDTSDEPCGVEFEVQVPASVSGVDAPSKQSRARTSPLGGFGEASASAVGNGGDP
jgi:hypothetical protein